MHESPEVEERLAVLEKPKVSFRCSMELVSAGGEVLGK